MLKQENRDLKKKVEDIQKSQMNCLNSGTSTVTIEEKDKTLSEAKLQHEKLVTSVKCNLKFEMEKLI